MKNRFFLKLVMINIIILAFISPVVLAEGQKKIAILPFEMISNEDISYLQDGIRQMLHSRLQWKDHVIAINKNDMDDLLKNLDMKSPNAIKNILNQTHADYILTGSITKFSNAFSIDTKIIDVKNSQFLSFFDQSPNINQVIPKLNVIAANINKRVFDRKTATYNRLANEQLRQVEKWKRQNPEKMMPQIPPSDRQEKSTWWKFWEFL